MVVGFITTYAISAITTEFQSLSGRGVQHYVIKFGQWLATGHWFSPDPSVSSTNKIDSHDITEIYISGAKHNQANKHHCTCTFVLPSECCNWEKNSHASEITTIVMIVNIAMETFWIIISNIFDHFTILVTVLIVRNFKMLKILLYCKLFSQSGDEWTS
jgi:hypothetical protein